MGTARTAAETFRLGEYLGEEMEERGWTSLDVAARMAGESLAVDALFVDFVLVIDDPRALISQRDYRRLETAFGVSAGFFERLDAPWRERPGSLSPYEAPDHLFAGTIGPKS